MMKSIPVWKQELSDGVHAARLASLYCCTPAETASEAARYAAVLDGLEKTFGSHAEAGLYSAPGRTEIGGNHTDHQHGRVLAGSVNIDMIAAAAPNDKNQLRVQSEGYDLCVIDLNDLEARKEEENTTASLLRGECAAFTQRGAKLAGLDVYISSNVPKGSGVSSSAAFEVLIGVILNDCFMTEKVSPIAIAQIGQWAENVYFGKPCGLMDQMASSVGNIITIDFADPAHPDVEPVQVDFSKAGLALCILDSCADHADLTDEYAAVPAECRAVAAVCGGEVLRDVPFDTFLAKLPECRRQCGDRAVLPSRLKQELFDLADVLVARTPVSEYPETLQKHAEWAQDILARHPELNGDTVHLILQDEVGQVFAQVLADAGVYKLDEAGRAGFVRFLASVK